ncbi:unnamed protein product [Cylicocyclus nassatus]|uniref:Dolichyl-diphosphooligosaccharide--protein glycosyltransferase subunit 2 n=1 Tax=Cylicocyclus nassatus TaxID=53992 RepID=A0AA36MF56_CYLNA|nr:unnamed protein product [Cylicocyclus nassatus]
MHPAIFMVALSCVSAISLNSYWNESDTRRLSGIFEDVLKTRNNDLESFHYIVGTLKALNVALTSDVANVACETVKKADLTVLDNLYHAVAMLNDVPSCVLEGVAGARETVEKTVEEVYRGESLYWAFRIADHLKIKVDQATFDKALTASMRKDDDPANMAWIMNAASFLEKEVGAKYFNKILNLVAQADEVDGKYLRFDESIVTTAVAVRGIVALAEKQGKKPAVPEKKLLQFTNYLLSRKQAVAPKITYHLLGALKALADNTEFVPVVVSREGPVEVASDQPIKIALTNVLGKLIEANGIRAGAKSAASDLTLISNLKLEPMSSDSRFWTISPDNIPTINDFIRLHIKIESNDKRLIGTTASHVLIKKSRNILVDDLEIEISKIGEEISENSFKSVTPFVKSIDILNVDRTKHLHIFFSLKYDDASSHLKPHQTFVMFKHGNEHEVFYTANPLKDGKYAVDIDFSKNYKDFDGLSGIYTAYLIIGDAFIQTPLTWPFADFMITVPSVVRKSEPVSYQVQYEPKPEIKHIFREPERRPAVFLSDSFTILCLAPLSLLLILWNRIGVNSTKMPMTAWVALFHVGLSAMFGLYVIFWLRLNMFDTLKYLSVIGSFTFIAGNRVLRAVAARK